MNCLQKLLAAVFIAFVALTGYAVHYHGVCEFAHLAVATPANLTLTTDLAISLSLVSAWLWRDARTRGVSPWPYLLLTAVLGSVGPLAYLIGKSGCTGSKCSGGERMVS